TTTTTPQTTTETTTTTTPPTTTETTTTTTPPTTTETTTTTTPPTTTETTTTTTPPTTTETTATTTPPTRTETTTTTTPPTTTETTTTTTPPTTTTETTTPSTTTTATTPTTTTTPIMRYKPKMDLIFVFDVSNSAFRLSKGLEIRNLKNISDHIFNAYDTRVVVGSYSKTTKLLHGGKFSEIADQEAFKQSLNEILTESGSFEPEEEENLMSVFDTTKHELQQQFRDSSERYLLFTSTCGFQENSELIANADYLRKLYGINLIAISLTKAPSCEKRLKAVHSNSVIKYIRNEIIFDVMISLAGPSNIAIFMDDLLEGSKVSNFTRSNMIDYMFNYIEKDNGLDMLYFVMGTYDKDVRLIETAKFETLNEERFNVRKTAIKRTKDGHGNDVVRVLQKAKELDYSSQRRSALVVVTTHKWVSDDSASYFKEAMDLYDIGVNIFIFDIGGKKGDDIENISPDCTYYPKKIDDIKLSIVRETKAKMCGKPRRKQMD
ncbi:hypothetical protein AB6A40_005398, partial [Gnathostoma spinigerum]